MNDTHGTESRTRPVEALGGAQGLRVPETGPEAARQRTQELPEASTAHTVSPTRPWTPDRKTVNDEGRTITTVKVKRACNGCGTLLGDLIDRDVDQHGNLTDARTECARCRPLVELEAQGCRTWQLTPRNITAIDNKVDRDGHYAKGYFEWDADNTKTVCVGLRIGTGDTRQPRVVARYGDHLIRHLDGTWAVHPAPAV